MISQRMSSPPLAPAAGWSTPACAATNSQTTAKPSENRAQALSLFALETWGGGRALAKMDAPAEPAESGEC